MIAALWLGSPGRTLRVLATINVLLCAASPAEAAPAPSSLLTHVLEATVDWTAGYVYVQGTARPKQLSPQADRAGDSNLYSARTELLQKLQRSLQAIAVDSTRRVGDLAGADPILARALEALAQSYVLTRAVPVSDGTVVLRAQLPLSSLVRALADRPVERSDGLAPGPIPGVKRQLVVDARGAGLVPALRPQITDRLGNVLVRGGSTTSYKVWSGGDSLALSPAGEMLVVQAKKATGKPPCDLILSSADAAAARAFVQAGEARLVLYADPPVSP